MARGSLHNFWSRDFLNGTLLVSPPRLARYGNKRIFMVASPPGITCRVETISTVQVARPKLPAIIGPKGISRTLLHTVLNSVVNGNARTIRECGRNTRALAAPTACRQATLESGLKSPTQQRRSILKTTRAYEIPVYRFMSGLNSVLHPSVLIPIDIPTIAAAKHVSLPTPVSDGP
ncbi:hypothetical protein B9Z19DRAFT_490592 [Tuber borchii]|uniref:Uncharacterized protein n=1 Tax=Tuber borchii TaxID=42251 RepID=A0A2T6ZF36_TUBBO|nr:hypothetical protein B9Z19DRAFT_490592 [Tuber borchii]